MAGALTERDFVGKLERVGFVDVEVRRREPLGVDDCALYPLFTDDLLALMRDLIPAERRDSVGVAVVVTAHLPTAAPR